MSQSLPTSTPSPLETQPSKQSFGGQLVVFLGHEEGIQDAVFSPDGTQILTASQDQTARLWDRQGNLLVVFKGHKSWVQSAKFSPDGQRILTRDKTAQLWDRQGNLLTIFGGSGHQVYGAKFSPNGLQILTISATTITDENGIFAWNKDNTAQLWDSRGNLLTVFRGHEDAVRSAVFSPDGNQILTASNDKTTRLWDCQGNLFLVLRGHEDTILSAVFSPDGQQILTAGLDDTARLWDRRGNLLTVFQQGSERAIFSPDGRQILTSGFRDARLWDCQGNLLAVFNKDTDIAISGLNSVTQFSPNGQYIVASHRVEGTGLWDTKGNLLATFPATSVFSPDSQQILISNYNAVRLWDVSDAIAIQTEKSAILQAFQKDVARNTAQLVVLPAWESEFESALFSPDGQQILTTSNDKYRTVRLWDHQGNLLTRLELEGFGEGFKRALFSPDGQQILTARDNIAQLWDQQGNLLTVLCGHEDEITCAEFSPNGRYILTNGSGGTIRLWDRQGNLLITFGMGRRNVRFSPDGQYILGISVHKTVYVWDLQGNLLTAIRGTEDGINSATFSPDGQQILTTAGWGRRDNTARLWDRSGNLLTLFQGHEDWVFSATFSPDGQQILTASVDQTDRLWDFQGKLLAVLQHGYQYRVFPPIGAFSPNGQKILTRGDQTVWLWDCQGNLLAVLRGHEGQINSAEFSPNGRQIVTTSGDRTTRLWDVPTAIAIHAEQMAALQASQAAVSDQNASQAGDTLQVALQLDQQGTIESRQQSLQKLDEAFNLYRANNNLAKAAYTLRLIGNIYTNLGQFQAALNAYTDALSLSHQSGAKAEESAILNSLGRLYTDLADAKTALDYHTQALLLLYQLNDKGSAAATFTNIGDIQADTNEWNQALDAYTKALIISRPAGALAAEATALMGIGSTYIASADWNTALNAYQQSLVITRYLNDKSKETEILNQLSKIYTALGKDAVALEHYTQALALAQQLGYKTEAANIFYNRAIFNRRQNNLTAAQADVETAIQIIESLRSQIGSHTLRQSYFARNQSYYQFYIDLLMQRHQQTTNQGYDALALHTSERARARSLLEQLTEASLNLKADLDPVLLATEQRLTQALNAADQKRIDLLSSSYSNIDLEAVKVEIEAILQQLQHLEAQIRQDNPAYANLKYPDPLTLEDIQSKILDDRTLLLQYVLGADRSYLFLISKTNLKTYTLPPKAEIEALVEAYRALLQSSTFTDLSQGQQLTQMLLGQLADELTDQRLVIVGDGKLQLLPFVALPWGSGTSPAPLLTNHEIITLPSATSLAVQREQWQQREPAAKTVAVIADPIFQASDPRLGENATIIAGDLSQYESLIRNGCGDFDRLPHTAAEAEQILAVVPAAQQFSALGFDANYATATSPNLSQYQIVHLATHGCIQDNPLLSNLALSFFQANGQRAATSLLKLQDIYNLKLNAELVVLSACQTGAGKEVQGEGIVGLTRGFMYAGARRVLVSLWSVNDRATSVLMGDYYRQMLQQGLDPAVALQQAQLGMWQSANYSAPYYWAAFTIQGDW